MAVVSALGRGTALSGGAFGAFRCASVPRRIQRGVCALLCTSSRDLLKIYFVYPGLAQTSIQSKRDRDVMINDTVSGLLDLPVLHVRYMLALFL